MEQHREFVIPEYASKQTILKLKSLDVVEGLDRRKSGCAGVCSFKLALFRISKLAPDVYRAQAYVLDRVCRCSGDEPSTPMKN